ncbi:hypothetical protein HDU67_006937 [Dinochytrium kinnereticum]|nr:hypothetical protein HDU67_006937 [Dinochytrium kinnereticum]
MFSRLHHRLRVPVAAAAGIGIAYTVDRYAYASTLERNMRTLYAGIQVVYEYKVNFVPGKVEQVHKKVADLILDTCKKNAGLYIKFHRARLRSTGEEVAVKVQKPEIAKQIGIDLLAFRVVTYCLEKIFDLPLYWSASYIEDHIRQEVDFENEARNAEKAAKSISEVPSLASRVHVPTVHWPLTTKRVMTAEWIEGTRFSDTERVIAEGYDTQDLMTVMVEVFCDQIFRSGFVHCDPHPGNLIIRKRNNSLNKPDLVLLDHGLYVTCTDSFKHNYALLWKCLFTGETDVLEDITRRWGIKDVQAFASGTLQRPWMPGKVVHVGEMASVTTMFKNQMEAKERARKFLSDTDKVPKELIFIGRNLNIVRSNNKVLGSPVNRINLTARYAVKT